MATHVVVAGDNPSALARRYTGDATRWRELCRANPQLRTHAQWGCVFPAPGNALNLPADWVADAPAAATPAPVAPAPAPADEGPLTVQEVEELAPAAPSRQQASMLDNKGLLLIVGAAAAVAVAIVVLKRKGRA
jgi:hypothetical protein